MLVRWDSGFDRRGIEEKGKRLELIAPRLAALKSMPPATAERRD
jgi:hypothetical protein